MPVPLAPLAHEVARARAELLDRARRAVRSPVGVERRAHGAVAFDVVHVEPVRARREPVHGGRHEDNLLARFVQSRLEADRAGDLRVARRGNELGDVRGGRLRRARERRRGRRRDQHRRGERGASRPRVVKLSWHRIAGRALGADREHRAGATRGTARGASRGRARVRERARGRERGHDRRVTARRGVTHTGLDLAWIKERRVRV